MKDVKQEMKRVVPIMLFLLILSGGQVPAGAAVDKNHNNRILLRETNKVYDTQELGYITDTEQNNPNELPAVFRAFQDEPTFLTEVFIPILFRFTYSIHSNPLLTDRPPPVIGQ